MTVTDRKVLCKRGEGGVHITEVLLIIIGLAYITNLLEKSIGFNEAHKSMLTDGISQTYKPCSLR